ncbi:MAG: hypothetical protein KAG84_08125 [Bacteroidales bacterium]|nr:hypothetical protein [Bacteroidales bacterium]
MELYLLKLLENKNKWNIFDSIAFTIDKKGIKENYYLTKRRKEQSRMQIGVISSFGGLYSTTIKDILIKTEIRKVGVLGSNKTNYMKVECPFCKNINDIKCEYQFCSNCNKRFYLFDNNY